MIAAADGTLVLPYDFTYDSSVDSSIECYGVLVNKDITISGDGHSIDGAGLNGIFDVWKANVVLKDIVFVNGKGDISKENCGGALTVTNPITNLTVINCTFKDCVANKGGAIDLMDSSVKVYNSTFINNTAYCGGALYLNSASTTTVIDGCDFVSNKATSTGTAGGGAAVQLQSGNLVVNASSFISNVAVSTGAAINGYSPSSKLNVTSSRFRNNSASGGVDIIAVKNAVVSDSNFTVSSPTVNLNDSYDVGVNVVVNGTFDGGVDNPIVLMNYVLDNNDGSISVTVDDVIFSADLGSELSAGEHIFVVKSFSDESGNVYTFDSVEKTFTINSPEISTNISLELSSDELYSGKNITITPKVIDSNGDEVTVGNVTIYTDSYMYNSIGTIKLGESLNYTYDNTNPYNNPYYFYAKYDGANGDNVKYMPSQNTSGTIYYHVYANTLNLTVNGVKEITIYQGQSVNISADTKGNGIINLTVNNEENETLTKGVNKSFTLTEIKDYEFIATYTRGNDYYASCVSDKVIVHVVEAPNINVKIDLDEKSLSKNTNITVTVNVTNKGSEVSEGIVEFFNESNVKIGQVNLSESKTFKFNVGDVAGSYKVYAKYDDVLSENKTYIVKDTLTITLERSHIFK